jgi:hypothetical protein
LLRMTGLSSTMNARRVDMVDGAGSVSQDGRG